METIKIAGVKRADFGKKESKHIRHEGMIPCTIYGRGETVHSVSYTHLDVYKRQTFWSSI